jgi:hypothetical protein
MSESVAMDYAATVLEERIAYSQATGPRFVLENVLFGPQLAFARDPDTFATAVCSRRAGKSTGIGAWLLEGPVENPKAPSLFFTLTRGSAKRIIWTTMLDLNRKYDLGYEPNEADLILKRGGRGAVYLAGVDNKSEIEKIRGTGWGRAAGDEAQTLPEYMKELAEDVLMPSFMDHGGKLRMTGTPGSVPAGFFHHIAHSDKWKAHRWTVWDNPFIADDRKHAMLAKTLATRGVDLSHPSIRREWFGEWAFDADALVVKFDPSKNVFVDLPPAEPKWSHVIGVDLGYDDADAIAVLAFNRDHPAAYLVDESVLPKQTITQLSTRLKAMVETYKPNAIVVDTGGLGKKIAEEISSRTMLPLQPAEKTRKFEFLELLNDALRSGRFFVKKNSRFANDVMKVEWDRDKCIGDRLVISDKFHSDILDGVLYAFRESLHWLHKEPVIGPEVGSDEWAKKQARAMFEYAQRGARKKPDSDAFGGDMADVGWGGADLGMERWS